MGLTKGKHGMEPLNRRVENWQEEVGASHWPVRKSASEHDATMSYECDNDNHEIGCQCPGRQPSMTMERAVRVTWANGQSSVLTDEVDIRAVQKMTGPQVTEVKRYVTEWSDLT